LTFSLRLHAADPSVFRLGERQNILKNQWTFVVISQRG
jgi:hypothetical protein